MGRNRNEAKQTPCTIFLPQESFWASTIPNICYGTSFSFLCMDPGSCTALYAKDATVSHGYCTAD